MPNPTPQELLDAAAESARILNDTFLSLGATIRAQLNQNIINANDETRQHIKLLKSELTSVYSTLSKKSELIYENQNKQNKGQLKSLDITKQISALDVLRQKAENKVEIARANGYISAARRLAYEREINQKHKEAVDELKKQQEIAEQIEGRVGLLGKSLKGLSKIPIIGNLIDSEKVLEKMQQSAAPNDKGELGGKLKTFGVGILEIGKNIGKGILDPMVAVTMLMKKALDANSQTVTLGKALGESSDKYRANMVDITRSSKDVNVTTGRLTEAFSELVASTGFAYKFTKDQLTTQILLTKEVGLTADEAAQFQRLGVLNNKSSKETYNSFVKGLVATRNQLKVGIDLKSTLAEASKVTGQLAANLGYNPELIAKAVVNAKALGMTLEQAAKSGDYLLNFESSIEGELKAELLLGKQMNLERARAAALMGDQVTLANELAANIGTSADFTKLNVISQRALAESVGMTADALAETLRKREEALASGKSLAQINEDDAKKAIERQTAQEKFNLAIEKLSDLFGNLVAGPLGKMLDIFAGMVSDATIMKGLIAVYIGLQARSLALSIARAVAEVTTASALTLGIGGIAALAAGASALAFLNSAKSADDGIMGPSGKMIYSGAEGAIRLNDNDSIIAGTNLGNRSNNNDSIIAGTNLGGGNGNNDSSAMMTLINELKTYISKPAVAYIQGQRPFAETMGKQSELFTTSNQNQSRLA